VDATFQVGAKMMYNGSTSIILSMCTANKLTWPLQGKTLLHIACQQNDVATVQALVKAGARLDVKTSVGLIQS
jgi:hypothetical protein